MVAGLHQRVRRADQGALRMVSNRMTDKVRVNVIFVRYRLNKGKVSAICVYDGRTEKSQWTGRPVPLETWIPMKFVDWPFDRFTVKPRQKLQLDIPISFAEESKLIHAHDLQHDGQDGAGS